MNSTRILLCLGASMATASPAWANNNCWDNDVSLPLGLDRHLNCGSVADDASLPAICTLSGTTWTCDMTREGDIVGADATTVWVPYGDLEAPPGEQLNTLADKRGVFVSYGSHAGPIANGNRDYCCAIGASQVKDIFVLGGSFDDRLSFQHSAPKSGMADFELQRPEHTSGATYSLDAQAEGAGGGDEILGSTSQATKYSETLMGDGGVDYIYGYAGKDTIFGGDDGDHLYGGTQADEMYGGDGADFMWGGGGDDLVCGEDDNDWLWGDDAGGSYAGDDRIGGGFGANIIDGQGGVDECATGVGGVYNCEVKAWTALPECGALVGPMF